MTLSWANALLCVDLDVWVVDLVFLLGCVVEAIGYYMSLCFCDSEVLGSYLWFGDRVLEICFTVRIWFCLGVWKLSWRGLSPPVMHRHAFGVTGMDSGSFTLVCKPVG
ncbi:hypothetical protein Nepgr_021698 [Nepenthes gracilis]|uniref:Uncharacterized protein n=1 Tax=Nepenthes gracilis TaxID=150966 RepID=A0AAD3XW54_NEPGR|nr:hypothetical protein Nepgr_021698 [Nepenthes gracilis]